MAGRIEQRLNELGISLPEARAPSANYLPYRKSGNQVFISGQVSAAGDEMIKGKIDRIGPVAPVRAIGPCSTKPPGSAPSAF